MNKKGFTLIELLAVLIVLSIIMLIAVPNVLSFVKESKRGAHLNKAEFLERSAIDNYNIEIANNINPKALTYTFVDGVESSVNTTLKLVKRKKGFLDGI